MGWVDYVLIACMVAVAVWGWMRGAIVSLFALLGIAFGAVAAVAVAGQVITHIDSSLTRITLGLFVVGAIVVSCQMAAVSLGQRIAGHPHSGHHRIFGSVVGALIQVVAFLIAAWMIIVPVARVETSPLANGFRQSKIVESVQRVVPNNLRALPTRISTALGASEFASLLDIKTRGLDREVQPPNPGLIASPIIESVRPSVVKVLGEAPGCSRTLEGTGFVYSPQRVITNAHVVAGTQAVKVETLRGLLDAVVVAFDPDTDVAVLAVPALNAAALPFSEGTEGDADGIVIGFPDNGPYSATAVRVIDEIRLAGPNIYRTHTVERRVYALRGEIRGGNSGGPVINPSGEVIGVVFGAATDRVSTGYALTPQEISEARDNAFRSGRQVNTGACVLPIRSDGITQGG